ncbi:MAG: thiamine pyrophosphate-dependent enzyme, partial [Desulfoprunum sp.]|nr:thiamine pyrophosphate-dependent enzyme [Desulfoprunum sp.]
MPRHSLTVTDTLEYLSILDDQGNLDRELEPQIADEQLRDIYRAMLLGRRFDERMLDLQRQGRIGTFPPIKGQEATQMGAIVNLLPTDWFVPAFREVAAEIWRGRSMESVMLFYNGFNEGTIIPGNQKDLPIAVPV